MIEIKLKENLRFKEIFEIIEEAIAITTINIDQTLSKIVEANSAAEKIFGYTKEELLTKYLSDFEIEKTKEERSKKMKLFNFINFYQNSISFTSYIK